MEFSFGEQLNIILKRNNMTIQDLANLYETQTGLKMTRQNLSQRLKRDNFQEQDMRTLAGLLGYQVSIELTPFTAPTPIIPQLSTEPAPARVPAEAPVKPEVFKKTAPVSQPVTTRDGSTVHIPNLFRRTSIQGEINPLTGEEYLSNTVRQHPTLPNYVQVYDRATHEWNDVNEDYFWKFQANKKELLGSDYQEPIMI